MICTIYLILKYYNIKKTIDKYKILHIHFLRQAADFSIAASNNVNPILALVESCRAEQLYKSIQLIYGIHYSNPLDIDISKMGDVIDNQKKKILNDILELHKNINNHPLLDVSVTTVTPNKKSYEKSDIDDFNIESSSD